MSTLGRAIGISLDHKPTDEIESARIIKAGGFVEAGRVNGNLALSRAFGDLDFKKNADLPAEDQAVTVNPDLFDFQLNPEDEFLVLACDGTLPLKIFISVRYLGLYDKSRCCRFY
jgi:serine/threonine protein phosphatase PrpC